MVLFARVLVDFKAVRELVGGRFNEVTVKVNHVAVESPLPSVTVTRIGAASMLSPIGLGWMFSVRLAPLPPKVKAGLTLVGFSDTAEIVRAPAGVSASPTVKLRVILV